MGGWRGSLIPGQGGGSGVEPTDPDLPAMEAGRSHRFGHGVQSELPGAGTHGTGPEDESIDLTRGRVLLG
jgi:hypothetical protein